MGFLAYPRGPSITSSGPKASRPPAAPQDSDTENEDSQRSQNRQGWDVVSTGQAKGLRAARPSWPWAQAHPRAREQAGQREGGCVSKSSQLLFHLLALPDGPLGTQATPPSSVTRAFFHPGGTPPTAHPGTGRQTDSLWKPSLSNQSWRGREARNQTSQYTDPASPQGLNGAPITQVTRSLGTGLWCDGGGALPLPCPWPWHCLAPWWVGMELADTECCFSRHQISQG